jgi:hypothetical protein
MRIRRVRAELARLGRKYRRRRQLDAVYATHCVTRAAGKVDERSMRPVEIPTTMRVLLSVAGIVLMLAAAGAFAADDENGLPAGASMACPRGSLLQRFLTWPKEEGGENKDEGDNDEEKEEPLESDRPDFTDSSTTVGYRRLQIESGYTYTRAVGGDPTHDVHDLPELFVRYGLAERLELRVAWDEGIVFHRQLDRNSGRIVTESGSTDMQFGFKYAISKQDKWRPQSAVVVSVSAPVGAAFQSSRQVDPFVNYLYSWEFTKKLALNCSTGSWWTAESGDHFSRLSQSVSVEYELTEKLHVFNEWYAFFFRNASDNRPQHYSDAGLTYLVTPNFQLDWRAGLGLNSVSDGFFTGCGLTVRR